MKSFEVRLLLMATSCFKTLFWSFLFCTSADGVFFLVILVQVWVMRKAKNR